MKTITIHLHAKNSGETLSESFFINEKTTSENLKNITDEFFERGTEVIGRYYYDVESQDEFTESEESILEELELTPDF